MTVRIHGTVVESETGLVLPGLFVKAYDEDLMFDDLLGSTYTDERGRFEIPTQVEDHREFFDANPDVYLNVYAPDEETLLYATDEAVRLTPDDRGRFDVAIPTEKLGEHAPHREVRLLGDDGEERSTFEVGESLAVAAADLVPRTAYEFVLREADGEELFTSRLVSDADGVVPETALWPQLGLEDLDSGELLTVEDARDRWQGRELTLEAYEGDRLIDSSTFRLAEAATRPLVVATDDDGRVANGFEDGSQAVVVSGYDVPFDGPARVFVVERQHDWRPGDRFEPVIRTDGRPAYADVEIDDSGAFRLEVADAGELAPGAYDFVVRRLRYGYEDDERLTLRAEDLVTRRVTGLVIREEFMASKAIHGGCVNMLPISGRSISGSPYFRYADTFQAGEDVYAALDPGAIDPTLLGKMAAIYVVENKTAGEWSTNTSLAHLTELGGNGSVVTFKTQAGCINWNKRLIWPDAATVGEYDVVVDFGNDATDPASFVTDASFDSPADVIDGYFASGFRVVPDPTTDTQFAHAGTFEYSEGTATVTDDYGITETVERKAKVYFPADASGATQPSQISAAQSSYPVVVVAHGNSSYTNSYQGYDYLLEHLARNGFIAVSIHMNVGMHGTGRARMIFENLDVIGTKFGTTAANDVGLMGHSRGGEAVAIAARLNQQESLGHNINAVVSLAPTDQYTSENLGGAWATPYLVVYGSMDGDVSGGSTGGSTPMNTGFALYDRASDEEKAMAFVYGASHGRFNTVWGDVDIIYGSLGPTDKPKVISADAHRKIARGYMTAFFRRYLRGESQWSGIFEGEWVPAAVEAADGGTVDLYVQYQDDVPKSVDEFEDAPANWQSSTIGGTVSDGGTLPATPQEGKLYALDTHSPHDTGGLLLQWDGTADRTQFAVPTAHQNVTAYDAISFRVSQRTGSGSNPSGQPQDLFVGLTDGGGTMRAARVSKFGEIPPPHEREYDQYTKSAMTTIRVPLTAFTIKVLGKDPVDLTDVVSVDFEYGVESSGEIEIDSVQFTD